MQSQHATKWQNAQFTVYPATGDAAYAVAGFEASIPHPRSPDKYSPAKVNVFVTPDTRVTWAGSAQHIYIDTGHNVLGVEMLPFIGVRFMPSLVASSKAGKGQLEEHAKHVVAKIDFESAIHSAIGKSGNELMSGLTFIKLSSIFKKTLFREYGSSLGASHWQQLASFGIENGILRMDLTRYEGKINGTVWIRIADRTLIRAVENGLQVFPEEIK